MLSRDCFLVLFSEFDLKMQVGTAGASIVTSYYDTPQKCLKMILVVTSYHPHCPCSCCAARFGTKLCNRLRVFLHSDSGHQHLPCRLNRQPHGLLAGLITIKLLASDTNKLHKDGWADYYSGIINPLVNSHKVP